MSRAHKGAPRVRLEDAAARLAKLPLVQTIAARVRERVPALAYTYVEVRLVSSPVALPNWEPGDDTGIPTWRARVVDSPDPAIGYELLRSGGYDVRPPSHRDPLPPVDPDPAAKSRAGGAS